MRVGSLTLALYLSGSRLLRLPPRLPALQSNFTSENYCQFSSRKLLPVKRFGIARFAICGLIGRFYLPLRGPTRDVSQRVLQLCVQATPPINKAAGKPRYFSFVKVIRGHTLMMLRSGWVHRRRDAGSRDADNGGRMAKHRFEGPIWRAGRRHRQYSSQRPPAS